MSYVPVNLNDSEHKRAHEYFVLAGHPECHLKGEDVDFDIEYREYLVKKFLLDDVVEYANGSMHIVVDDNPMDYKLKLGFFTDEEKNDFAVEVAGKLRYNTSTNTCVFFPNDKTVRKITMSADSHFINIDTETKRSSEEFNETNSTVTVQGS